MLIKERSRYFDPGLFDEEITKKVSSVGILMHTGELSPYGNPSFVVVEQLDQTRPDGQHPFGILAGRVKPYEVDPRQTAFREALEEGGFSINPQKLKSFLHIDKIDKPNHTRIVFSYPTSLFELTNTGNCQHSENGIMIFYMPNRNKQEIGRLALIPRHRMYERGNPITELDYQWEIMHSIKAKLEGLRII
jgi:hypothetical protein